MSERDETVIPGTRPLDVTNDQMAEVGRFAEMALDNLRYVGYLREESEEKAQERPASLSRRLTRVEASLFELHGGLANLYRAVVGVDLWPTDATDDPTLT